VPKPDHIKIPIWLATIFVACLLAIAADTWRTVYAVKTDLRVLIVELKAKGVIVQHTTKLMDNNGIVTNLTNQCNQNKQETAFLDVKQSSKKINN